MGIPWYLRLFYMPLLSMVISFLLALLIKAKRMGRPELSKPLQIIWAITFVGFCVWLWFIPFRINLAFWIGLGIMVLSQGIFSLGYFAMREYPERKKTVVDWGIYRVSRHSHVLAGVISTLGTIVMGWNIKSLLYNLLWIYFVLDVVLMHMFVLYEERVNIEKFGQEYIDYLKRVPRYFLTK